MRKLEKKNTVSFNIFGAVIILVLLVFSATVFMVIRSRDANIPISRNSVVYNDVNEYIALENEGTISKSWDKKYYLKTDGSKTYCLGENTVIYNKDTGVLSVLGDLYRIQQDGTVTQTAGTTEISDLNETALYKLSDRKYLMTGSQIESTDSNFSTNRYVYIQIYKSGNALLMNDSKYSNMIYPIMLKSEELYFDISSEYAVYDENLIVLKSILGSSNLYSGDPLVLQEGLVADSELEGVNNNPDVITIVGGAGGSGGSGGKGGSGGSGGTGGDGGVGGIAGNGGTGGMGGVGGLGGDGGVGGSGGSGGEGGLGGDGGAGGDGGQGNDAELSALKWARLNGVMSGVSTLDISYTVSDITDDYIAVYVMVKNLSTGESEKIFLDKTQTNYLIRGRDPGTYYTVTLFTTAYYYTDGPVELRNVELDTIKSRTSTELGEIAVNSLTTKKVGFTVTLNKDYLITDGYVSLCKADGTELGSIKLTKETIKAASEGGYNATISFPEKIEADSRLYLKFDKVIFNGKEIEITKQAAFTYTIK